MKQTNLFGPFSNWTFYMAKCNGLHEERRCRNIKMSEFDGTLPLNGTFKDLLNQEVLF